MKKASLLIKMLSLFTFLLATSCDEINEVLGIEKDVNIESGLMAYYNFDDGTADDITENGLDGTLMNSPSFVTETVNGSGKAIFFNSQKEQSMSIPYNPFKNLSNYTATMWVKDFGYGYFIKVGENETSNNFMFYYDEDGLFKICLRYYNGDGTFTYDAKSLIDGNWHMIAITREGELFNLYVDGSLVASEEVRKAGVSTYPSILIDNHMKFDNLRLYNRAINAKEVKAIYDLEK